MNRQVQTKIPKYINCRIKHFHFQVEDLDLLSINLNEWNDALKALEEDVAWVFTSLSNHVEVALSNYADVWPFLNTFCNLILSIMFQLIVFHLYFLKLWQCGVWRLQLPLFAFFATLLPPGRFRHA